MKQLMMFPEPASLTLAEGTVMHPTFHELKQAMFIDEMNARHRVTAPEIAVLTDAPLPPKPSRKPRRKPVNVADSTPF